MAADSFLRSDLVSVQEILGRVNVLVTGGAGIIGSHVAERLTTSDERVLVVDDLSAGANHVPPGAEFERGDVAGRGMQRVVRRWRPDVVVQCAGKVSVAGSVRDPLRDAHSNVLGTIAVLQAAEAAGCRTYVYLSTGGAIYGDPVYLPCDEDHPVAPLSPYALSKWVGAQYLSLLRPRSMSTVVLRLANVYGPRQGSAAEAGVVAIFAKCMRRGLPVEIHGDGRQTRDFVYVADVVDAVMRAIAVQRSLTPNIGTGTGTSIVELYEQMASLVGYTETPEFGPPRPGHVHDSVLAVGRAQRELSWVADTTLTEGLRRTLEHASTVEGPA
jgi:UDP-glucose 4-epimerase